MFEFLTNMLGMDSSQIDYNRLEQVKIKKQ